MRRWILSLVSLLLPLAQLRSCADGFCTALDLGRHDSSVVPLRVAVQDVRDVVLQRDGTAILVTGLRSTTSDETRDVIALRDGATTPLGHVAFHSSDREALIPTADGWWYSVVGATPRQAAVAFVSSTDPTTRYVPITTSGSALWLPTAGGEPSGLYISGTASALVARDIRPDGVRRSWQFASGDVSPNATRRWSAERLHDGTLALLCTSSTRVTLRRLIADQPVIEETLYDAGNGLTSIATAVDAGDRIAVVVADEHHIFALTLPNGTIQTLATFAAAEALALPHVIATRDGFLATWRHGDALEARHLTGDAFAVELGRLGFTPGFHDERPWTAHADADGTAVVHWVDARRDLRALVVPEPLAGFATLRILCRHP